MQQFKILLSNTGHDSELVYSFRQVLEAESEIELLEGALQVSQACSILSTLQKVNADAILVFGSADRYPYLLRLVREIRSSSMAPPVIVVTDLHEPKQLSEVLLAGASEFLLPPLDAAHVLPRVWRLLSRFQSPSEEIQTLKESVGLKDFIGESPALLAEIRKIPIIARCDASGLIAGETGTGKELCARAIHYLSPRCGKPFLPVNCGGIPCDLIENELFGHESGAYTGAKSVSIGLIQEAEGGTLFLDEIDSLPLLAQAKLLRFLQEKEYRRLGSRKTNRADVRIIAAANSNLEHAIHAGRFRQDLYCHFAGENQPPICGSKSPTPEEAFKS